MKRAILLVDHGSRRDDANAQLGEVAEAVRRRLPGEIVEFAHMELAEPTIAQAFARCVEQGAHQVVVHPYFLAPGRHSTEDIPSMVKKVARAHPELSATVTQPLGLDPRMSQIILDRIQAELDGL